VKVARADTPLGAMGKLLNSLVRRIRKVEGRVDSVEDTTSMIRRQVDEILSERARRIEHLEHELQWKTEEWERTLNALVGSLAAIKARYEEHEHKQGQKASDGADSEDHTPATIESSNCALVSQRPSPIRT
jgi:chromosome segregation ATPase